jgi:hypothetical protein
MTTMTQGRGAWTLRGKDNGSTSYLRKWRTPRDGTIPIGLDADATGWYESVHFGVLAMQRRLLAEGYGGPNLVTGEFGWATRRAARAYQAAKGIAGDGVVGPKTMESLVRSVIARVATLDGVDPQWIYGLAKQESGFDPGAQGWDTPYDRGVWQFNTSLGTVTVEDATDIDTACELVTDRFARAWKQYKGQGKDRRIDCSILQHRSPVAADMLFRSNMIAAENATYIANVRSFAALW